VHEKPPNLLVFLLPEIRYFICHDFSTRWRGDRATHLVAPPVKRQRGVLTSEARTWSRQERALGGFETHVDQSEI
jgi:hypothetical protein